MMMSRDDAQRFHSRFPENSGDRRWPRRSRMTFAALQGICLKSILWMGATGSASAYGRCGFRQNTGSASGARIQSCGKALVLLIISACLWQTAHAFAQAPTSPLEIQVDRLYSLRSESPLTLLVRLTPTVLLDGKLQFKLWNGRELLTTLTTDDEVINPPMKTVRYVLPAPELHGYSQQLDLTVEFITKEGRLKFDPFSIIVPSPGQRDMVVGYVAPETMRLDNQMEQLLDSLKFETYSPLPDDRSVRTINTRVSPDQLPTDAISNCAFNMLFIAAEAFSAVNESRWPPILEWVEAGGSLCVLPSDNLSPHHLTVLNKLLEAKHPQGAFLLGPNNELLLKDEPQRKPYYHIRRGLGRVAIVPLVEDQKLTPDSPEWRTTAAHLWNIRQDQLSSLVNTGKWDLGILMKQEQQQNQDQARQYAYQNIRHQQRKLGYLPISSGDQLLQAIVPSNLHIIPLPLIAFVLFLYVLAIGPGDYFILGYFNLRKWTWVTFPVTTLVFAAGALFMAEWYMNTGDARRSVYFIDVGIEGQPERVNQFEMLFNSRQKVSETPLSRSLFTSLDHQMYGAGSYQQMSRGRGGAGSGFVGPAELTGRIPSRFVARQLTPKWVPQLNRILTLNTEPFATKLNWQQFQLPEGQNSHPLQQDINDNAWKKSLIDPISAAFPSKQLTIGVYAGGQYFHVSGERRLFAPQGSIDHRQFNQYATLYGNHDFLSDVSMLQDAGLFSVVTSLAPTGGRHLEDMSMVDPSDPRQWLLVVGYQDGQNWIVYRKLYAGIE